MKFELTQKALDLKAIVVQHGPTDSYLLEDYSSWQEACACEAEATPCVDEEGDELSFEDSYAEYAEVIEQYSICEVLEAAEQGEGWPLYLGLVEIEDEEGES